MTKHEFQNPKEVRSPNDRGSSGAVVIRSSSYHRIWALGFRHAAVLAVAGLALAQPAATPPDEEDVPEAAEPYDFDNRGPSPEMMERLNLLVPEGRAHEGVRYPVYSDDAAPGASTLQSLVECRRVTRVDETHLRFEEALVSSFGNPKFPDAATRVVSLRDAEYDLQHDILFSDAPVQMEDRSTRIRGGSMIHDHATGLTIFKNGFNLYQSRIPDPPPAPSSPPKPAAEPTEK